MPSLATAISTMRHLLPLALAYSLVPAVLAANSTAQTSWRQEKVLSNGKYSQLVRDKVTERVLCLSGAFDPMEVFSWDGARWNHVDSVTPGPAARRNFGLAFDTDRDVLVLYGGEDMTGKKLFETWEWSATGWTQRFPANRPDMRVHVAMAYDEAQDLTVAFGGLSANGLYRNSTWLWDGTEWVEDLRTTFPNRRRTQMAYDELRQKCVIYGGGSDPGVAVNDTWEYDATGWSKRTHPTSVGSRVGAAMAYNPPSGHVVLYGGSTVSPSQTWRWNGVDWKQINSTPNRPGTRIGCGMAFDAVRGELVLFGGAEDSKTFAHPNMGWYFRSIQAPEAESGLASAYDPIRDRVILFGGDFGNQPINDGRTFEWDGQAWSRLSPANPPSSRWDASLVYDPSRGRSVLFGGFFYFPVSGELRSDTWEWDGATWTRIGSAGPMAPRSGAAMAFDPTIGGPMLFGGNTTYRGNEAANDTWQLVGTEWNPVSTGDSPQARYHAAMAHDPSAGNVLLYGGFSGTGDLGDTWVWDGAWTELSPSVPSLLLERPSMTYDTHRDRMVLVGIAPSGELETWEWVGGNWLLRDSGSCAPRQPFVSPIEYHAGTRRVVHSWIEDWCSQARPVVTRTYGPDDPASLAAYGQGCPGTQGIPVLDSEPAVAWLGEDFTLRVDGIPAGGSAFLSLGGSMTSWGANPLPFSLAPWGMPGCMLHVRPDRSVSLLPAAPGVAERTLFAPLSQAPTLAGRPFYAQGVVLDPGANPAGIVLSNALAGVLGVK